MDLELDSIYEELVNYHINDYAIFEATLKRDFLEATGVLNEAQDEIFCEQVGESITNMIFNFKNSISKITDRFVNYITDYKKNKWDKRWAKEKDIWEKADLTGLKLSKPVYIPSDAEILRLLKFMMRAVNFDADQLIKELESGIIDKLINDANDRYKNHKKYFKDCHNSIWNQSTTEPFKVLKKETVINNINLDVKNVKYVLELKTRIDKHLDTFSKAMKAQEKKSKPGSKVIYTKSVQFLNAYRRDSVMVMNSIIKEAKALFKNDIYIYNVGIAYAKKQKHGVSESVDIEYIEAIAELEF